MHVGIAIIAERLFDVSAVTSVTVTTVTVMTATAQWRIAFTIVTVLFVFVTVMSIATTIAVIVLLCPLRVYGGHCR
jgi:hypothetical protein